MSEYKIIACDLDGTLLDASGAVSCENYAAIHALGEMGVHFVPASGRSLAEIPEELMVCEDIRYYIHSSGAAVYDRLTGERISFCFPRELSARLFEILFNRDCHITVRQNGRMYTSKKTMNESDLARYNVWPPHANLLYRVGEAIDGFEERFKDAEEVEMISIFMADGEELARLKASLCGIEGVNVASACEGNIELTYTDAGKGNALLALAKKLSVPSAQTIAVGDSENDIPMVCAAGLGLAMRNATDELKAVADEVICHNSEHAIAYIREHFFI